ncbi:hypothetical protein L596_008969 [Steinernema carpocapsae]|uniref:Uncharacterized protein n=1 Tax=Steinernema carpocapsae TaxID=34508 RepID=A0A4U5PF58_STECR|nr:hypothetical protein L596_008969 [Steinernema carpocapsae]
MPRSLPLASNLTADLSPRSRVHAPTWEPCRKEQITELGPIDEEKKITSLTLGATTPNFAARSRASTRRIPVLRAALLATTTIPSGGGVHFNATLGFHSLFGFNLKRLVFRSKTKVLLICFSVLSNYRQL